MNSQKTAILSLNKKSRRGNTHSAGTNASRVLDLRQCCKGGSNARSEGGVVGVIES